MAEQYPNRSDLRNPMKKMAAPGQTYGEAGKQLASQDVVPMGSPPSDIVASPSQPRPQPGNVVDLFADSEFPDRQMNNNFVADGPPRQYSFGDPVIDELRQIYFASPNDDLARLLSAYDRYFR
jgi:hypothetical protein